MQYFNKIQLLIVALKILKSPMNKTLLPNHILLCHLVSKKSSNHGNQFQNGEMYCIPLSQCNKSEQSTLKMSTSEEEDYMSDKLLTATVKEDIRPGLTFNHRQKRTLELHKKKQQLQSKWPKSYQQREKHLREKGLNTAISSDNKGFQLLTKMGFKPGASLGKGDNGLKEPINVIIVKETTSGLGRAKHVKTVRQLKELTMNKKREQKFKAANVEKSLLWTLRRDFYKAQRVCEELDFREDVKVPKEVYFWTKESMRKLKEKDKAAEESKEENERYDEKYEQYVTEENLYEIIDYLREKYLYCLYCVWTGKNKEDFEASCPGRYRLDHDSEEF